MRLKNIMRADNSNASNKYAKEIHEPIKHYTI